MDDPPLAPFAFLADEQARFAPERDLDDYCWKQRMLSSVEGLQRVVIGLLAASLPSAQLAVRQQGSSGRWQWFDLSSLFVWPPRRGARQLALRDKIQKGVLLGSDNVPYRSHFDHWARLEKLLAEHPSAPYVAKVFSFVDTEKLREKLPSKASSLRERLVFFFPHFHSLCRQCSRILSRIGPSP